MRQDHTDEAHGSTQHGSATRTAYPQASGIASRPRVALAVLAVCLALAVALTGCSPQEADDDLSGARELEARIAIFDMSHGEVFGPDDTSELGQSTAVGSIQDAGFDVEVNTDELTRERLRDASLLVLAGPMRAFTASETAAIDEYVRGGGNVLMTIHVPFAVSQLPAHFGLDVGGGVVALPGTEPGEDAGVLLADLITPDPVTEGVDEVLVLSGWPVIPREGGAEDAIIVVATPHETGADMNGDGVIGAAGELGPFGMVGVSRVGQGTVIVVGDDAVFANAGIAQADNERLLDNILQLIEARTHPM